MTLFCTACGHPRSGGMPFCGRCGFSLSAEHPPTSGAEQVAAPTGAAVAVSEMADGGGLTTLRSHLAMTPVPPTSLPPSSVPPAAVLVAGEPAAVVGGRACRRAHAVLWSGIASMLVVAYLADPSYYSDGDPVLFPRGVLGGDVVRPLWHLAGAALLAVVFWLLPRTHPAPTASLVRALAYVVGAVVSFELVTENLSLYRYAYAVAFALIAMGWLEARGRRRIWFLGSIPVALIIAFLSGVVATLTYQHVPFLLLTNALPVGALVALAWLAATTGTRGARPVSVVAPAPRAGGMPPGYPGVVPQNALAVVAFVLSFFLAIPGVVCGHVALSQIKRTGERGRGLAIAALVIGYVGLAAVVGYVLLIVALVSA